MRKEFIGLPQSKTMNCYYHPERNAVAQCVVCGKNLCTDCAIIREGQNYCRECLGMTPGQVGIAKLIVPALGCGALAGILTIAPVSALRCACCLWIVLGGGLAVYLVKRFNNIKGKISTGMAALTGGLTGFIASLFMTGSLLLGGDFGAAMEEAMQQPEVQEALQDAGMTGEEITGIVVLFVILIFIAGFVLFGVLGGIISNEATK
jgi:hypothetical protein